MSLCPTRGATMFESDDLPLLDENGYPTEEALRRLREWPQNDPLGWFAFAKSMWWRADWGWTESTLLAGHHVFDVSTGGWSGNEEIIAAMRESPLWHQTWEVIRRGGHYTFLVRANGR